MFAHKYQCDKCHEFFNHRKKFKSHICNNQIDETNEVNNFSSIAFKDKNLKNDVNHNQNKMVKCHDCDLIFNNIGLMKKHFYKIHKNIKKEKNSKNKENKTYYVLKNENNEINNNIIRIENKIIKKKKKMNKNEEEKDKIENTKKEDIINYYKCQKDEKLFETEEEYINHFKKYHPYDFPFYCKECNIGFSNNKSLKNHFKKIKH